MCTSPILVRNRAFVPSTPGFRKEEYHRAYDKVSGKLKFVRCTPHHVEPGAIRSLHDRLLHENTQYVYRPCGRCPECLAVKQSGIYQRVAEQSKTHYIYMVTLTINNKHMESITLPYGSVPYVRTVPWKVLRDMFKRIRNKNLLTRPFKYLAFSELGSQHARPHFHLLVCLPKYDSDRYADIMNLDRIVFETFRDQWKVNVNVVCQNLYEYNDEDPQKSKYHTIHVLDHIGPRGRKYFRTAVPSDNLKSSRTTVNHRAPKWEPMFDKNVRSSKINPATGKPFRPYDCHRLVENGDDLAKACTFYVSKYLGKDSGIYDVLRSIIASACMYSDDGTPSKVLNKRMFNEFWNKVKPRMVQSLNFGNKYDPALYVEYLRAIRSCQSSDPTVRMIIREKYKKYNPGLYSQICSDAVTTVSDPNTTCPLFFDSLTGNGQPLSRYYREMVPATIMAEFVDRRNALYGIGIVPLSRTTLQLLEKSRIDDAMSRSKKANSFVFESISDIYSDDDDLPYCIHDIVDIPLDEFDTTITPDIEIWDL